ncbi:lysM and putative peptidoglycan-binding domain-containing protein 3-like [Leptidea sinapis]|uniref:LysM domain-containing protein n=1 Tax=Leptidea sinapis TaxID=189913 RepID=A0A5E4QZM7_9NEOP|nr:lysM and putative peptidoglycan-binding domain-containing protein 3-like [Leptidea sinapis]VVD03490.1 unnamed protein product [Leptidea sinapis]
MKQRTRLLNGGDDILTDMNGTMNDDINYNGQIQLHRIKPQDHFIEAQVQVGDTLQAIALRFHCSISELKRINHIHKDNEIFARRTIKIPVTPYSVLTELIPIQQETVPTSSNNARTTLTMDNPLEDLVQNKITPGKHENQDIDFAIDCNTVVMNSTLAPSITPYTDVEPTEPISEDTQLLPNKEKVSIEAVVVKQLTSQGADFGLKWFHLLCFVLVLGVVTPIVYILFYLDKPEHTEVPSLHPT